MDAAFAWMKAVGRGINIITHTPQYESFTMSGAGCNAWRAWMKAVTSAAASGSDASSAGLRRRSAR
jgi:hypothetical protein